jgi:hypothetical protein
MADCPGAVRYAPRAAACRLLRAGAEVCPRRPAVPEAVQSESAVPLRAAGQAEVSGRARPSPAADRVRHRPEATACRWAQPTARRAQAPLPPVVLAQLAVSQPRAASWLAAVAGVSPVGAEAAVRQPEVPVVAEEPRQVAVAARDGAAAVRQLAAVRAAGVAPRLAEAVQDVAEAAVLQLEAAAPGAAGGRQRAAPDVPAQAQPSAAPWVCRRDRLPPWSAQPRSAHPVRATEGRRIALP